MTEKESIKIEKYLLDRKKPNYDLAEKVMEAVEKQIPKKIDNKAPDDLVCGCHSCGEINALWKANGDKNNYCGNCGQKIDWSKSL